MESENGETENQGESRVSLVGRMVAAAREASSLGETQPQPEPDTEGMNEEDALRNLTGTVRDQNDLERDITLQANAALMEAEDKKDQNRIDKLKATKHRLDLQ